MRAGLVSTSSSTPAMGGVSSRQRWATAGASRGRWSPLCSSMLTSPRWLAEAASAAWFGGPPAPACSGDYCRDFNQKIIIDGVERNAYGKACLQPDGSWRIVNLN